MRGETAVHAAFAFIRKHTIASRDITVYQYQHKVTGAMHYHLATNHDENVFLVAFRTQPMDSKGEAHILEHTVLCGSEKFPVRDPFFAMMRRSLNTFMNAMTNSDWTAYPFATQNKKDFQNLLSIYLDAVFAPNINPLDFAQEGIRVELENDQPVFKGVVFNEMKGALSPPSRQLYHRIAENLYPETTYHYNPGGEPADITQLSYEELLAFYKKHYHPSNAIFMTFGNQRPEELQAQFESLALHKFQKGETLYSKPEQRLSAPKTVVEHYAIEGDDLKDKTFHVLAWLLPQSDDIQLWFGLRLVAGVLLQDSSSPLMHYLETCGYAKSVGPILGLNDKNFEMSFYCGVQGSNPEYAAQFKQDVLEILQEVASKPISSQLIEALLHQIELQQREIAGGNMPYGLNLFFRGLSAAIYHQDPVQMWDIDLALQDVKNTLQQDPMWISSLIQQYLIDNPHRIQLTFVPDPQKSIQIRQAEQDLLDNIAKHLTEQDREQLLNQADALKKRQQSVEDHEILPKVTLADIPAELNIANGELQQLQIGQQAYPLHVYPTGTNGLYYQQVLLQIPKEVLQSPYFSIFSSLVGQVGAAHYDYLQFQQLKTAESGGLWMTSSLRTDIDDRNQISAWLVLSTKSLSQKQEAIALLKLAFEQLRFDEKPRILELLQKKKIQWQSGLANSGQTYAMQNASRHMSALALHDEQHYGLAALNWLTTTLDEISNNENAYADFITQLKLIHGKLLQADKQFLLVCESQYITGLKHKLAEVWSDLAVPTTQLSLTSFDYPDVTSDQAWLIQSNVQFCATAYPAVAIHHADAAVFMVLGGYLRNGFLHHAIREQGGAYGGGANYDANACAFRFFSFRDPRLAETFTDFAASIDWLLQQDEQPQQLESAILGTISGMDKPSSPASEAISACHAALHGRTPEFRQQLRQNILAVTQDDLKRVAKQYLRPEFAQKAVIAPFAKEAQLESLGFAVSKVI
ncbi:insulinase family protein [Acinetobacter populi]|uniref:Peptidase M16 n=1 Tax=Acinetobacter populi TaxID=1582270 RepID=A0A1Z9YUI4_9GAMM|nr:insulinase family protein [Acinetobacter populi]OUY05884.1 peptidase M16 [Acinetobacter populi]